ncbi:tetratricopeptide repeat protein [Mucilaginibacter terrae]|uniref:Tetratricopeptide (TPR) repeat protein n=1 Tax=Mucilaginibacter terrae TaxID=1955052 RepID=A0ABU3GVR2_9SPHI|nr:tetratricopeptide repeat protein [Mucilaginibacter terrae]MDT3403869.1 tetratricopeptide (TPR) repeat protein [Mucilaginibacter terrae]
MKAKQIVAIVAVIAIMGYLYAQPVKGLVKPKEERAAPGKAGAQDEHEGHDHEHEGAQVDVATVSTPAKATIGGEASEKINALEAGLAKASAPAQKQKLQLELAKAWDAANQQAPAAFYYMALAQANNSFDNWINAGNRFNDAYKFTQDTAVQPAMVKNAITAFKAARAIKAADLEAQTGLGIAYVNQTSLGITDAEGGSPMQGITLLLDVVAKDPDNWKANLNLGQFAMKSGQFQKAVDRFSKMVAMPESAQRSKVEPYFYLAESYKQLGKKKEAIEAYQKCKELMGDPAMGHTIDNYINELKN